MSVSGISTTPTSYYQTSNSQSQFQQSFGSLISALNSGNLTGAQQAYSALGQLQSSGQGPLANSNSPLSQTLSQIGQDLQSGNLSGAQQALSSLQQTKGHHHHHGHYGGGENSTSSSNTVASSPTSSGSTTNTVNTVNITT